MSIKCSSVWREGWREKETYRYFDCGDGEDVNSRGVDMTALLQPSQETEEAEPGDVLPDDHQPEDAVVRLAVRDCVEVPGQVGEVEDHH